MKDIRRCGTSEKITVPRGGRRVENLLLPAHCILTACHAHTKLHTMRRGAQSEEAIVEDLGPCRLLLVVRTLFQAFPVVLTGDIGLNVFSNKERPLCERCSEDLAGGLDITTGGDVRVTARSMQGWCFTMRCRTNCTNLAGSSGS